MQSPPPIPPGGDPTAAIITAIFTGIAAIMGAATAMTVAFRSWRDKGRGTVTVQEPGTVVLRAEDFERLLRRSKGDGADDHEA